MNSSIYTIINGHRKLIVCFGGLSPIFGGMPPYEFLSFLSKSYPAECDCVFIIDKHQCWYHKGIDGLTTTIDDTVLYLNNTISKGNYDNVLFMGTSAGGYGAILFGSLCKIDTVVAFNPQTILTPTIIANHINLKNSINTQYINLKNSINNKTKYIVHGDIANTDKNNIHHILHCTNLEPYPNVSVIRHSPLDMKTMKILRDNGQLKQIIDDSFQSI